jgi:rubrerythrin
MSITIKNLESAFAGESQAFTKYMYFAKIAREEGNEDVAKHFECSLGEAEEYIDILRDHGTRKVLYDMGMDEKEVEKLLKK